MPRPNYISLTIDGRKADIDPDGQIPTVNYALEDEQDFEVKKSADSFDIELPATLVNDQIHNTLHDPSVVDNTTDQSYDNFKPATYMANGIEILIGKYLCQKVVQQNGRPVKYKGKIYGLNGDWVIALKEKTLLDFVNPRTHEFTAQTIQGSWNYDGRTEAQDFVYSPVRYLKPFGEIPQATQEEPDPSPDDLNVIISDMKPSISPYWILYRAFKSVGYRIVSSFLDTDYYRRGLLPWTWGGFDYMDDTRWEPLKFLASGPSKRYEGDHDDQFVDLEVKDDSSVPGTYDNNNLFSYTNGSSVLPYMMKWDYPASSSSLSLGKVKVSLSVQLSYDYKAVQQQDDASLLVFWYKNGVLEFSETVFAVSGHGAINPAQGAGFHESFFEGDINPGDYIGVRIRVHTFQSTFGFARVTAQVQAFQLNFVRLTEGSEVSLLNYPKFAQHKFMDLLRGELDLFDLQINTDPIRKEVYIEPAHGVAVDNTATTGYYNRKQLDWSQKVDISKESELELFSDYEREVDFTFKDDTSDGGLKKVQDRNQTTIGKGKYVLPERFKTEKKDKENRFYSAVMHYSHESWKNITGVAPQLIALIPENVSNTSGSVSENTFAPKRAWYKGNITGVGGWRFNGAQLNTFPYLFAVNYQSGGHSDPVLSYSDQLIGGQLGIGLLKKFFLQRMAIVRNGRRYSPIYITLNNKDVANFLHRESIIIRGVEYLITSIQGYNPIEPDSTAVNMWMFVPVSTRDRDNTYPSIASVQSGNTTNSYDTKWWPHILLTSDIPI